MISLQKLLTWAFQHIYTDAYLHDNEILTITKDSIRNIVMYAAEHGINLHNDDTEIVFDVTENDGYVCGYYLVSHSQRTLFWLDSFETGRLCGGVQGVTKLSHISGFIQSATAIYVTNIISEHQLESEYWHHWETFPNERDVTPEIIREFRDILSHGFASCVFLTTVSMILLKLAHRCLYII